MVSAVARVLSGASFNAARTQIGQKLAGRDALAAVEFELCLLNGEV